MKAIYSPANGYIVDVRIREAKVSIVIFMPLWVKHHILTPLSGVVKKVYFKMGKFKIATSRESELHNTRCDITINTDYGFDVTISAIAGIIARRIKYFVKEGDRVEELQKIAHIGFGSRVILTLPRSIVYKILIKPRSRVKAGKTQILLLNV